MPLQVKQGLLDGIKEIRMGQSDDFSVFMSAVIDKSVRAAATVGRHQLICCCGIVTCKHDDEVIVVYWRWVLSYLMLKLLLILCR